ncbi:MAG TPA: hypothetical protein VGG33_18940 [Polyangia bacterium]
MLEITMHEPTRKPGSGKLGRARWAAPAFLLLLLGCEGGLGNESRPCTLIGCGDQASIRIRHADGTTPAFGVLLDMDGAVVRCTAPPAASPAPGQCNDARVEVSLRPLSDCTEVRTGNSGSGGCSLNGKFEEVITIRATPTRVHVMLLDTATTAAERRFDLTYTASTPNGPACGPVCRQSDTAWVLP